MPSLKSDALIPHESTLERDAIILYEGDPRVRSVIAQPVTIDDGRIRYTPDLLVEFADGAELVEVKYREDLEAQWPMLRDRVALAEDYAESRGWSFGIDTEEVIRTHRLANIKALWRYRKSRVSSRDRVRIRSLLLERGPSSALEIIRELEESLEGRQITLSRVWALVADGTLAADLDSAPLTNSTPLSLL